MSNISIALQITALGMGLVFAAIILLWWMMALLTRVLPEKEASPEAGASDSAENAPDIEREMKSQAAAIAVAIALADHQVTHAHPLSAPPTAIVSAWQLGMRTRQLSQKGTPILRNPRKVGSK
jgi:Na+-transporting methylmalonyl-CoA/oxaloacetate decarboxylase gamma subunit